MIIPFKKKDEDTITVEKSYKELYDKLSEAYNLTDLSVNIFKKHNEKECDISVQGDALGIIVLLILSAKSIAKNIGLQDKDLYYFLDVLGAKEKKNKKKK